MMYYTNFVIKGLRGYIRWYSGKKVLFVSKTVINLTIQILIVYNFKAPKPLKTIPLTHEIQSFGLNFRGDGVQCVRVEDFIVYTSFEIIQVLVEWQQL